MARWRLALYIAGPAVFLLGLGLLEMESDQSLMALVPFALLALLSVTVILAVGAARDSSVQVESEPYWPKSRWGALAHLIALFSVPAVLVMAAVISLATDQWLAAGVLLAMAIPPLLLRLDALAAGRRMKRHGQEHLRRE